MRLLLECENQIAFCEIWDLLCFFLHDDCVTVSHALFDVYFHLFVVVHESHTVAVRTLLSHCVALAATLWTLCLHLHLHPKTYLHVLHYYASAIAFLALSQFAIFCARTSALRAVDIPIDVKLPPGA